MTNNNQRRQSLLESMKNNVEVTKEFLQFIKESRKPGLHNSSEAQVVNDCACRLLSIRNEKNNDIAFECFNISYQFNQNKQAATNLCYCLLEGIGTPKNLKRASQLYNQLGSPAKFYVKVSSNSKGELYVLPKDNEWNHLLEDIKDTETSKQLHLERERAIEIRQLEKNAESKKPLFKAVFYTIVGTILPVYLIYHYTHINYLILIAITVILLIFLWKVFRPFNQKRLKQIRHYLKMSGIDLPTFTILEGQCLDDTIGLWGPTTWNYKYLVLFKQPNVKDQFHNPIIGHWNAGEESMKTKTTFLDNNTATIEISYIYVP